LTSTLLISAILTSPNIMQLDGTPSGNQVVFPGQPQAVGLQQVSAAVLFKMLDYRGDYTDVPGFSMLLGGFQIDVKPSTAAWWTTQPVPDPANPGSWRFERSYVVSVDPLDSPNAETIRNSLLTQINSGSVPFEILAPTEGWTEGGFLGDRPSLLSVSALVTPNGNDGPSPVPEPTSASILGLALLVTLHRRLRSTAAC